MIRYLLDNRCNASTTVYKAMFGKKLILFATVMAVIWAGEVSAFRNCAAEYSDAWSAATRYTVGELAFDDTTGLASGTETIYNYSNDYPSGAGECHVTYELSGNYVPGVEVFVLAATRSNYSDTCPSELLTVEYPAITLHTFQIEHAEDGTAVFNSGDNGAYLADGFWQPGKAVYKTGEQCSIF